MRVGLRLSCALVAATIALTSGCGEALVEAETSSPIDTPPHDCEPAVLEPIAFDAGTGALAPIGLDAGNLTIGTSARKAVVNVYEDPWGDCTPFVWSSGAKRGDDWFFPPRTDNRDGLVTLLPDGRVLLGYGGAIYDPIRDQYEILKIDVGYRVLATATVLQDKRTVLLAGGAEGWDGGSNETVLLDLVTKKQRPGPPMHAGRQTHRAVLLDDGRVLVVGGHSSASTAVRPFAEIYDPESNTWTASRMPKEIASSTDAAWGTSVAKLADGTVFVAHSSSAVWRYVPKTDQWRFLKWARPAWLTWTITLRDGRVLAGYNLPTPDPPYIIGASEIFDPDTETFVRLSSPMPVLNNMPLNRKVELLPCGSVLLIGNTSRDPLVAAARFDPKWMKWFDIPGPRPWRLMDAAGSVRLKNGSLLIAHGRLAPDDMDRFFPLQFGPARRIALDEIDHHD